MGLYKIYREKPKGKAIHGLLYACDLQGRAEDCPLAQTLENTDFVIPAGTYKVVITLSPRFQKPMPLLLGIKGRSGIRIHWGTKPSHSLGCVLITDKRQYQALFDRLLNEQDKLEEIILEICE